MDDELPPNLDYEDALNAMNVARSAAAEADEAFFAAINCELGSAGSSPTART